jgi:hypothetical protein
LLLLVYGIGIIFVGWFEIVPLVGHVRGVQETRSHRFAFLD